MCTNDIFNVYFCAHSQNRVVDFCSFAGPFILINTCVICLFIRKKAVIVTAFSLELPARLEFVGAVAPIGLYIQSLQTSL